MKKNMENRRLANYLCLILLAHKKLQYYDRLAKIYGVKQ